MRREPIHPRRSDGSAVDATFELTAIPVYDLIFHHKAGRRGSASAINSDYHEGLELLLERLASVGASILGVSVDSSVARKLDPAARELDLPFPLSLDEHTDVAVSAARDHARSEAGCETTKRQGERRKRPETRPRDDRARARDGPGRACPSANRLRA